MKLSFDLEKEFGFYGAYHNNVWNILTHIVCVPAILWSAMLLTTYLSGSLTLFYIPEIPGVFQAFPINGAAIIALVYGLYYISLETFAGLTMSGLLFAQTLGVNAFMATIPEYALVTGIVIQVIGWAAQVLSHLFFEGRAPALLDSFGQSLMLAPLFVWMEVLFFFGYKKELHKKIQATIDKNIQANRLKKSEIVANKQS